jgi:hypothetical protein
MNLQQQESNVRAVPFQKASDVFYRRVGIVFLLLLALFPLILILKKGVNVPFQDEFSCMAVMKAFRTGQDLFNTLWAPHNEHRLFASKLALALLISGSGWNSLLIMLVSWALVCATSLVLYRRFASVFDPSAPRLWLLTVVIFLALFFSPIQKENWLWAWQLTFFLAHVTVVLSILTITEKTIALPVRLALSLVLAFTASFSALQGLMVWPALLVAAFLTESTARRKLVACAVLGAAALFVFFVYRIENMRPSVAHLSIGEIAAKPAAFGFYLFGLLGAPMAVWVSPNLRSLVSFGAGCMLFTVFLYLCALIFSQRRLLTEAVPWIALAVFSFAFCVITTYGRAGLGIETAAVVSRYTTHELLFTVAVLALGYLATSEPSALADLKNVFRRKCHIVLLCLIGFLTSLGYVDGFKRPGNDRKERALAKMLMPLFPYFDSSVDGSKTGPFFALMPVPGWKIFDWLLRPYSDLGYLHLENASYTKSIVPFSGRYAISPQPSNEDVNVTGTLTTESLVRFAVVFLKPAGWPRFIAAAPLHLASSSGRKQQFRWKCSLSAKSFLTDGRPLELWIYDKASKSFIEAD